MDGDCGAPQQAIGRGMTATQPEAPNPFRQVTVQKVANGFIVVVGCQTFVAKTWTEASNGLSEYYKDPAAAEKKYCKR